MEKKKKTFPKALIIAICVISLVAMLSLSAFAAITENNTFNNSTNTLKILKINNNTDINVNMYYVVTFTSGTALGGNTDIYEIRAITLRDSPIEPQEAISVTSIESELSFEDFCLLVFPGATSSDEFQLSDSIIYTQHVPSLWDGVTGAVPTLLNNIGSTATAIVNNEYLALFCLVLPLLSLAVGLLIRMRDRT